MKRFDLKAVLNGVRADGCIEPYLAELPEGHLLLLESARGFRRSTAQFIHGHQKDSSDRNFCIDCQHSFLQATNSVSASGRCSSK